MKPKYTIWLVILHNTNDYAFTAYARDTNFVASGSDYISQQESLLRGKDRTKQT